MDTYYELLGLNPGASQIEIKKAYFKLIRQYSPESDPKQFQKIREAYEQLRNMKNELERPSFPKPCEPLAEEMLKQIMVYRKAKDKIRFRDSCEEAYEAFPNEIQFLYLLVIAQRQCENTGKAVKNAEKLILAEPENKWFQRELAMSYLERGYTQKAFKAFQKAYDLGCRDLDFVLEYSLQCEDFKQYDRGMEILLEVIRREKRWTKEEIGKLLDIYSGLFFMNEYASKTYYSEIVKRFCGVLEQYAVYMGEYIQELSMLAFDIQPDGRGGFLEYQMTEQIFKDLEKICHTDIEKNLIKTARIEFIHDCIFNDPRIGATYRHGYEAYVMCELEGIDEQTIKFAKTDVGLCMIEEREEILLQAEIIQQDYPDYYEKIEAFLQKLKDEKNIVYLKNSLQKTYGRLEPKFDGGYYYKMYPEEKKKAQGILLSDEMGEKPYVRSTKKIGRNDPCPCGSGKKYKQCCMNKD